MKSLTRRELQYNPLLLDKAEDALASSVGDGSYAPHTPIYGADMRFCITFAEKKLIFFERKRSFFICFILFRELYFILWKLSISFVNQSG